MASNLCSAAQGFWKPPRVSKGRRHDRFFWRISAENYFEGDHPLRNEAVKVITKGDHTTAVCKG